MLINRKIKTLLLTTCLLSPTFAATPDAVFTSDAFTTLSTLGIVETDIEVVNGVSFVDTPSSLDKATIGAITASQDSCIYFNPDDSTFTILAIIEDQWVTLTSGPIITDISDNHTISFNSTHANGAANEGYSFDITLTKNATTAKNISGAALYKKLIKWLSKPKQTVFTTTATPLPSPVKRWSVAAVFKKASEAISGTLTPVGVTLSAKVRPYNSPTLSNYSAKLENLSEFNSPDKFEISNPITLKRRMSDSTYIDLPISFNPKLYIDDITGSPLSIQRVLLDSLNGLERRTLCSAAPWTYQHPSDAVAAIKDTLGATTDAARTLIADSDFSIDHCSLASLNQHYGIVSLINLPDLTFTDAGITANGETFMLNSENATDVFLEFVGQTTGAVFWIKAFGDDYDFTSVTAPDFSAMNTIFSLDRPVNLPASDYLNTALTRITIANTAIGGTNGDSTLGRITRVKEALGDEGRSILDSIHYFMTELGGGSTLSECVTLATAEESEADAALGGTGTTMARIISIQQSLGRYDETTTARLNTIARTLIADSDFTAEHCSYSHEDYGIVSLVNLTDLKFTDQGASSGLETFTKTMNSSDLLLEFENEKSGTMFWVKAFGEGNFDGLLAPDCSSLNTSLNINETSGLNILASTRLTTLLDTVLARVDITKTAIGGSGTVIARAESAISKISAGAASIHAAVTVVQDAICGTGEAPVAKINPIARTLVAHSDFTAEHCGLTSSDSKYGIATIIPFMDFIFTNTTVTANGETFTLNTEHSTSTLLEFIGQSSGDAIWVKAFDDANFDEVTELGFSPLNDIFEIFEAIYINHSTHLNKLVNSAISRVDIVKETIGGTTGSAFSRANTAISKISASAASIDAAVTAVNSALGGTDDDTTLARVSAVKEALGGSGTALERAEDIANRVKIGTRTLISSANFISSDSSPRFDLTDFGIFTMVPISKLKFTSDGASSADETFTVSYNTPKLLEFSGNKGNVFWYRTFGILSVPTSSYSVLNTPLVIDETTGTDIPAAATTSVGELADMILGRVLAAQTELGTTATTITDSVTALNSALGGSGTTLDRVTAVKDQIALTGTVPVGTPENLDGYVGAVHEAIDLSSPTILGSVKTSILNLIASPTFSNEDCSYHTRLYGIISGVALTGLRFTAGGASTDTDTFTSAYKSLVGLLEFTGQQSGHTFWVKSFDAASLNSLNYEDLNSNLSITTDDGINIPAVAVPLSDLITLTTANATTANMAIGGSGAMMTRIDAVKDALGGSDPIIDQVAALKLKISETTPAETTDDLLGYLGAANAAIGVIDGTPDATTIARIDAVKTALGGSDPIIDQVSTLKLKISETTPAETTDDLLGYLGAANAAIGVIDETPDATTIARIYAVNAALGRFSTTTYSRVTALNSALGGSAFDTTLKRLNSVARTLIASPDFTVADCSTSYNGYGIVSLAAITGLTISASRIAADNDENFTKNTVDSTGYLIEYTGDKGNVFWVKSFGSNPMSVTTVADLNTLLGGDSLTPSLSNQTIDAKSLDALTTSTTDHITDLKDAIGGSGTTTLERVSTIRTLLGGTPAISLYAVAGNLTNMINDAILNLIASPTFDTSYFGFFNQGIGITSNSRLMGFRFTGNSAIANTDEVFSPRPKYPSDKVLRYEGSNGHVFWLKSYYLGVGYIDFTSMNDRLGIDGTYGVTINPLLPSNLDNLAWYALDIANQAKYKLGGAGTTISAQVDDVNTAIGELGESTLATTEERIVAVKTALGGSDPIIDQVAALKLKISETTPEETSDDLLGYLGAANAAIGVIDGTPDATTIARIDAVKTSLGGSGTALARASELQATLGGSDGTTAHESVYAVNVALGGSEFDTTLKRLNSVARKLIASPAFGAEACSFRGVVNDNYGIVSLAPLEGLSFTSDGATLGTETFTGAAVDGTSNTLLEFTGSTTGNVFWVKAFNWNDFSGLNSDYSGLNVPLFNAMSVTIPAKTLLDLATAVADATPILSMA